MLGNPNVGKTTLFNKLAGRRQKTANFPGTTQEAHVAVVGQTTLIDMPGVYGLGLDTPESSLCRGVLAGSTSPEGTRAVPPDVLLIVLDATSLLRSLALAAEALQSGTRCAIAVNMIDDARRRGLHIDPVKLEEATGVPVLLTSGKTGEGVSDLQGLLARSRNAEVPALANRDQIEAWADETFAAIAAESPSGPRADDGLTDRLDRAFTHPILGVLTFAAAMTGLFWVVFKLASVPMDFIDLIFSVAGGWVSGLLPPGAISSLLTDGVIAGVGGTVIFLPQILLLFFLIALLEQTGYLARAAFVIDRILRPFGLPGHAFIPLLSGHACAIPALMSARAIPDRRDRLATILAVPFMSCSARIPVYVLLTGLLFPETPGLQAVAFTGCYVLGALAGLLTAFVMRRTILRGKSGEMALELPAYRLPDVIAAGRVAASRGWLFLKKAGTVILGISIVLWWLSAYPTSGSTQDSESLRAEAQFVAPDAAAALLDEADTLEARAQAADSFLGRIGQAVQPVFAPLGADRQLTVGILASFAAREVFVSTMAVQVAGSDDAEDAGVLEAISSSTRDDGSPVFDRSTSWSMLVYFVLAMQCLPTLVVTAREAAAGRGGWKWAMLQFGWMSAVAYGAAALTFAVARSLG